MKITDNLFKKIEKKTSVSKDTILDLAKTLQDSNMKNEDALRNVINEFTKENSDINVKLVNITKINKKIKDKDVNENQGGKQR